MFGKIRYAGVFGLPHINTAAAFQLDLRTALDPRWLPLVAVFIAWDDLSESVPAFLTLVGIPLAYSIADGLALGFISYPILKVLTGRARAIGPISHLVALLLMIYFVFVRPSLG